MSVFHTHGVKFKFIIYNLHFYLLNLAILSPTHLSYLPDPMIQHLNSSIQEPSCSPALWSRSRSKVWVQATSLGTPVSQVFRGKRALQLMRDYFMTCVGAERNSGEHLPVFFTYWPWGRSFISINSFNLCDSHVKLNRFHPFPLLFIYLFVYLFIIF